METVCAAVSWVNFEILTHDTTFFRIFRTRDRLVRKSSRTRRISCMRVWPACGFNFRCVFQLFNFHARGVVCCAFVEFYQVETLDTRCTSTSGLTGSQPYFRPYALRCAVLCCVVLFRVRMRFYDFCNRQSKRRETVTYVLDIVCPRVACKNFEVSS